MKDKAIKQVKSTQRDYNLGFKLTLVAEVEKGNYTYKQIQQAYGIQGRSTVLVWLRKYGTLDWSKPNLHKRPNPQPTALRNDAGNNNTNYRFNFALNDQSFATSVLDGNGNIDTVIQAITSNPLSVSELSN